MALGLQRLRHTRAGDQQIDEQRAIAQLDERHVRAPRSEVGEDARQVRTRNRPALRALHADGRDGALEAPVDYLVLSRPTQQRSRDGARRLAAACLEVLLED